MRMTKFLKASLVAATLLSGMAAQASILNFDLTGDYTAHWQYDTDTMPYNPVFGRSFTLTDVTGMFPGASDSTVTIDFASAGDGGGLTIADHSNISIILANASGTSCTPSTPNSIRYSRSVHSISPDSMPRQAIP